MLRFFRLCSFQILFYSCYTLYGQQEIMPLPLDKLNRDSLNKIIVQKEKAKDYKALSDIYGAIYTYYFQTNYTDSAAIYALKAEEYSYKAGDSAKYYFNQVQLGELSVHSYNYETAKKYYQKAQTYYQQTKNYKMLFHVYGGLRGIYEIQKDTPNMIRYNSLAIEANKQGHDTLGEVILNDKHIQILIAQNKIDESIRELHKNLWLINNARAFGNSEQVRIFWRGLQLNLLGLCYNRKKEYNTAIKYLKEAQRDDKKTEAFSAQNMSRTRLLVKSYININEKDSSLKYFDLFFQQAKKTFENLNPEKLNEISIKYETEKKQREIAELQQKNHVQQLAVSKPAKIKYGIYNYLFSCSDNRISYYQKYPAEKKNCS